ncbi:MAG: TaqI-like C-terminal specificity domain-containing protein, partial [Methanobacteriota archaeon]
LIGKIEDNNPVLSNFADIFYGIKAYQVGKGKPPQTKNIRDEKPFTSDKQKDKSFLPFFDGKHIGRYKLLWNQNNWLRYGPWLAEPRNPKKYDDEKILIRKIVGETLNATYVPYTSYCNTLLYVLKTFSDENFSYQYLLGILNSRLIGWYFRKKFQISSEDTFPQIMIRDILQFPIPVNEVLHDSLVSLVSRMLGLHKSLSAAKTPQEKSVLGRQIEATDDEINRLVYKLYGLTGDEVRIVEEGN